MGGRSLFSFQGLSLQGICVAKVMPGHSLLPGLTCHRISTEVVVWGVTEMMVGASSGAGERGKAGR